MPKVTKRARTKRSVSSSRSFIDYIRSGESYTSLILGIVVVIIASILLISFFKNRGSDERQEIASQNTVSEEVLSSAFLTLTPKAEPSTVVLTPTVTPVVTKTEQRVVTPTKVQPTPTVVVSQSAPALSGQVVRPVVRSYTVKADDTLWSIAESQYKSGYNWVDIAKANSLTDANQITTGMKLTLPDAKRIAAGETQSPTPTVVVTNKITANSYKVQQGDFLWDIAVRKYGDGYKWVEVARVNKIANPDVILPGATLTLPKL